MTNKEKKILKTHKKYSARDKYGYVHCSECPYGIIIDTYARECIVSDTLDKLGVDDDE